MAKPGGPVAAYAAAHDAQVAARGSLPETTPLLSRGDTRKASNLTELELEGGLSCTLADYSYAENTQDGENRFRYCVVFAAIPESIGFAPRLLCYPTRGRAKRLLSAFDGHNLLRELELEGDDPLRLPDRELKLESDALGERFKIRVDHDLGENWARQLFSPSFIAWLAERAPDGLGFELIDGALCVFVPEVVDAEGVEQLCAAATEIARRIRDEPLEEAGSHEAGRAAMADRPQSTLTAMVDEEAAKVDWAEPPADEAEAIRAYRGVAARKLQPWLYGIGIFVIATAVGALLAWGGDGNAAIAFLTAIVGGPSTTLEMIRRRKRAYGKAAFAAQYARSRGLTREPPRLFQARNMRLQLPGVVDEALSGALEGELAGTLAFVRGTGSDKKTEFDAVVTELQREPREPPEPGEGLEATVHERTVAVWRKTDGNRAAASLDELCRRVAELLRRGG